MVVRFDVGVQAGDGYHTGMEIEVMARCLCFASARWFLFFCKWECEERWMSDWLVCRN
jgi:hypothetical protein